MVGRPVTQTAHMSRITETGISEAGRESPEATRRRLEWYTTQRSANKITYLAARLEPMRIHRPFPYPMYEGHFCTCARSFSFSAQTFSRTSVSGIKFNIVLTVNGFV